MEVRSLAGSYEFHFVSALLSRMTLFSQTQTVKIFYIIIHPPPALASHSNLPQLQIELNTHIAGQVITLTLVRTMENSLSSLLINSYVMLGMSYVCISGLLEDFSISLRRNF